MDSDNSDDLSDIPSEFFKEGERRTAETLSLIRLDMETWPREKGG